VRDEVKKRAGIPIERVEQVLASGGTLSEADLMWCRTRYFVDGLVIGSESFVNQVFALSRGYFGAKRKSGARRMRRVATSLCTMRDLRKDVLQC
jgi:putative transposase